IIYSRDFVFLPKFLNVKQQNLPKPIVHRNLPFSCDRRLQYDKKYRRGGENKVGMFKQKLKPVLAIIGGFLASK
ncbi:MAG: hypothetical protein DRP87_11680, partial [Spirochaetes bacterium]